MPGANVTARLTNKYGHIEDQIVYVQGVQGSANLAGVGGVTYDDAVTLQQDRLAYLDHLLTLSDVAIETEMESLKASLSAEVRACIQGDVRDCSSADQFTVMKIELCMIALGV